MPIFVDQFSTREIRLQKQRYDFVAAYFWDHYCYFARQRSLILDDLKRALAENCQTFSFCGWQRVVNYAYTLEPLSAKGSVLNDPGGRFNIGDIDQTRFPRFAALYMSEQFRNVLFSAK